jgi:hypothetical protein
LSYNIARDAPGRITNKKSHQPEGPVNGSAKGLAKNELTTVAAASAATTASTAVTATTTTASATAWRTIFARPGFVDGQGTALKVLLMEH